LVIDVPGGAAKRRLPECDQKATWPAWAALRALSWPDAPGQVDSKLNASGCAVELNELRNGVQAALTPPAPGARHDTTLYVPAEAAGALASTVAATTTTPANPRIRARIARECTPLEGP
jgi:hypothetical protein